MRTWRYPSKTKSFALALTLALLWAGAAAAEINVDDTLVDAAHALMGPDYLLDETSGHVEGTNAFFSFSRLEVETDKTLTITVPDGVERVFFRITGRGGFTEGFVVNGPITVTTGIDLIVLSPLGVEVGDGGSLAFEGALTLSSGDAVALDDSWTFEVGNTPSDFGTGAPTSYAFDGENGVVSVSTISLGRTSADILLAGSSVRLDDGATVAVDGGGRIDLAAVGNGGEVSWSGSELEVSSFGDRIEILAASSLSVGEGRLAIAGGTLQLQEAEISQTATSPDGVLQLAGNVIGFEAFETRLSGSTTPKIRIEGGSFEASAGSLFQGVSEGESGGLFVDVETVSLDETTFDFSSGTASAAPLEIRATGLVDLVSTTLLNQSSDDGDVDGITIEGELITLSASRLSLSSGSGAVSGVLLKAVDRLNIIEASVVDVSTTAESTGSVRALAGNVIGIVRSDLTIETGRGLAGTGDLILAAERVLLNEAQLAMVAHSGDRGMVKITAESLDVSGGTVFSMCSDNPVRSGDIYAEVSTSIAFRGADNATAISTCNLSTGDAGVVALASPTVLYEHDLELNQEATDGDDGRVETAGAGTLIVDVDELEITEECGLRRAEVRSGLDDGVPGGIESDGALQDAEVDHEHTICLDVENDAELLYRVTDLAATDECPDGSQRIEHGPDTNGDGLLDDDEAIADVVACRGTGNHQGDDAVSDDGCSCRTAGAVGPGALFTLGLVVLLSRRRRP